MSKQTEALKLALEALEFIPESGSMLGSQAETKRLQAITAIREALADSALDRMADNARELGLDYGPPCKTGSQCTSKCPQCDESAQQQGPVAWRTKNATPPGGYVVFQQYPQAVAELGGEIEPLYTSPPASKPLTDEQIREGGRKTDPGGEDLCHWSFKQGVRFAEHKHGIKGDA